MDEDRPRIDKKKLGQRIEQFWKTHGFPDNQDLKDRTGLTGLNNVKKGAIPRLEHLMAIVEACNSNLGEFFQFIDARSATLAPGIDIQPQQLPLFENLATILSVENPRRILAITVNLEEFAAAARAEKAQSAAIQEQKSVVIAEEKKTAEELGNTAPLEKKKAPKQQRRWLR